MSEGPRTEDTGPGGAAWPQEPDMPANPYLKDLIRQCPAGGVSEEDMRRAALGRLDEIISDYYLLFQTAGCKLEWFKYDLEFFGDVLARDGYRLPFLDGDGGPELRHFFLLVLMNS